MTLKNVIEALVFGSPKPIQVSEILGVLTAAGSPEAGEEIRALVSTKMSQVEEALRELRDEYIASERGFRLVEQVNGWTLVTNPGASPWVKQLYPEAKPTRLSGPALETLAIIAYRQPVTRADVEAVRGVAVDGVMQVLLDRSLVKITGRADVPGRPLLYGTTEYFLQHFGLRNTGELPNSDELKRVVLPTAPVEEGGEVAVKPKGKKAKAAAEAAATAEAEAAPAPTEEAPPAEGEKNWKDVDDGPDESHSPEPPPAEALDTPPTEEPNS
ncbi:MAG TPA: SMC-Scp complex subunit ScpB [Chthoniobacteraceae bacterium]|jgi:segregation and condensation protein B|nr:SMC-Scp complex subunit ScpB [Chthoniobacteraceae bacterium]